MIFHKVKILIVFALQNPPNFLVQSELGTYVTPIVVLPEQPIDADAPTDSLIDTSDTSSLAGDNGSVISESIVTADALVERYHDFFFLMTGIIAQTVSQKRVEYRLKSLLNNFFLQKIRYELLKNRYTSTQKLVHTTFPSTC